MREDSSRHRQYRTWLEQALNGEERIALFEPVLASVLRVGTHPAIYKPPTPRRTVEAFIDTCVAAPAAVSLRPDERHWLLFRDLCSRGDCRGNLVQDAYLAALALEHNATFITTDRDYSRFPRLRWRHPLDDAVERTNPH